MSYLPFESGAPRCVVCNRVLDGEAEVRGEIACSDCSSRTRHQQHKRVRERQDRIEEDLA